MYRTFRECILLRLIVIIKDRRCNSMIQAQEISIRRWYGTTAPLKWITKGNAKLILIQGYAWNFITATGTVREPNDIASLISFSEIGLCRCDSTDTIATQRGMKAFNSIAWNPCCSIHDYGSQQRIENFSVFIPWTNVYLKETHFPLHSN